jgi:hypothetical protein
MSNTRSADAAHTWDTATTALRFGRAPGISPEPIQDVTPHVQSDPKHDQHPAMISRIAGKA